jgi:hypothetical protein
MNEVEQLIAELKRLNDLFEYYLKQAYSLGEEDE